MYEKVRTRKEKLNLSLNRIASKRVKFARWLLDKLLGSFFISFLILYHSIFGFQLTQSPFQVVYFLVTFLTVLSYILSAILIPSQKQKGSEALDGSK
jgi:hypothetical protein